MKILVVTQNPYLRGGSDAYAFDTARLLVSRGHQVHLMAGSGEIDPALLRAGVTVTTVDAPLMEEARARDIPRFFYNPEARKTMRKVISDFQPDVAHLHIYYGRLTPAILGPLASAGVPIVQTLHEHKLVCAISTVYRDGAPCHECGLGNYLPAIRHRCNRGRLDRTLITTAENYVGLGLGVNRKVDAFVAVSHYQRDILIRGGVDPDRVEVLHNFTEVPALNPTAKQADRVLLVGRLEPIKGVSVFLEMARALPHLSFHVLGDGTESVLIDQADLPNVVARGQVPRTSLSHEYQQALCTVVPSISEETFGLSALESLANGCPVVASDLGGLREVVRHEETGFLENPGDSAAFVARIEQLHTNPTQRSTMGAAGRDIVAARFSPDTHFQQLESLYNRVVEASTP